MLFLRLHSLDTFKKINWHKMQSSAVSALFSTSSVKAAKLTHISFIFASSNLLSPNTVYIYLFICNLPVECKPIKTNTDPLTLEALRKFVEYLKVKTVIHELKQYIAFNSFSPCICIPTFYLHRES